MADHEFSAYVVDDEPDMLDIIRFALETQGFATEGFRSAESAWDALQRSQPDLVVLDVMMPGVSGVTMCRRIKARWDVPVMLVTAKSEVADRIVGLEAEADDYVGKPFHPRELALRARRLVRRSPATRSTASVGPLRIDEARHEVFADGTRVSVTSNEFRLLAALMSRPGEVLDFSHLLLSGWGEVDHVGAREMIKAAVFRLRHKLDGASPGAGHAIESVRGRGYTLRADTPSDER